MPFYHAPGIYVEEISTGARPIMPVGTSTAAFVGVAPDSAKHLNESWAVNNWTEFVREFVGESTTSTNLSNAVFGFFRNGGSRCYVVNVGKDQPISGGGKDRRGLDVLESVDEVAIIAAPGYTDAGSYEALLTHCENLKDRVAILDCPEQVRRIDQLTKVATVPAAPARRRGTGDTPPESTDTAEPEGLRPRNSVYAAAYFPWITVRDALLPRKDNMDNYVNVPPSGHLAGIYARSDGTRGVQKAPANEPILGALNVSQRITRAEQELLNPAGINCIRFFPREGILVWGARTIAPESSEWRYLNVRRLFNMIEESIAISTRWVVFEPNDYPLWKSITRDVRAFLTLLWRDGALMGQTPEEAFFIQCDEETNPPDIIDAGMVVTRIGIAPVKPAEFVVFRIGQHQRGAETTIEGGGRA